MRSILAIAALAAGGLLPAQAPPAFDVASVKPVDPRDGTASYSGSNEYLGSLQALVKAAYGVEDFRIAGGPKWLDGDKFSIVFKPANAPQRSLMLRTLLADRFKLAVHTETRTLVSCKIEPETGDTPPVRGPHGARPIARRLAHCECAMPR